MSIKLKPSMSVGNIVWAKDNLVHTRIGDENEHESMMSFVVLLKLAGSTLIEGKNKCQQVSK